MNVEAFAPSTTLATHLSSLLWAKSTVSVTNAGSRSSLNNWRLCWFSCSPPKPFL